MLQFHHSKPKVYPRIQQNGWIIQYTYSSSTRDKKILGRFGEHDIRWHQGIVGKD